MGMGLWGARLTRHLLHQLLVLHGHGRELLADLLVNVQVLGHAAVDADHLALAWKIRKSLE